jgi:hypothetical protein
MITFEETRLYATLRYAKHGIVIAVGTGQEGKTVLLNAIANNHIFRRRKIALVNYDPALVARDFPPHYRAIQWPDEIEDVPRLIYAGIDILIIDDAAFLIGARDHATRENKNIQKLITIASHYGIFIFISIQSLAMLDIGTLMSQGVVILNKMMDTTALKFERPEFQGHQAIANVKILRFRRSHPDVHPKAVTYCTTSWETFTNSVPEWWHIGLSLAQRGRIPT